jgi:hypothetical protein
MCGVTAGQVMAAWLRCPDRKLSVSVQRNAGRPPKKGKLSKLMGTLERWHEGGVWAGTAPHGPRWQAPGETRPGTTCLNLPALVNSERSWAARAPHWAGRGTGDPSQSAGLPLPHERAIQSRLFLWQQGDSQPCECLSCPCLAQQGHSQSPSRSSCLWCILQPPGTAVPGNTKGHQLKMSSHLGGAGRVRLGFGRRERYVQGLSPNRDPLPKLGNCKTGVRAEL